MGDRRIPIAMPTTVLADTMTMVVEANDSYALALLGLRDYATTSALGPIRNIAATYAYAMWLLESPDEKVRLARAYRLTMNAIDQLRQLGETLDRIAPQSEHTLQLGPRLRAAADQMSRRLREVAQEDDLSIAAKPKRSELMEKHLTDSGGYMLYSLLSNAGVHPGAGRATAFYGRPGTGRSDYDFKGLYHVRAYWIGVSIRVHADLCDLAAPVLGWEEWATITMQTAAPAPVSRRYSSRRQRARRRGSSRAPSCLRSRADCSACQARGECFGREATAVDRPGRLLEKGLPVSTLEDLGVVRCGYR